MSWRLNVVLHIFMAAVAMAPLPGAAQSIRVGWQTQWAVQGQIVMGLTETTIPDRLGLNIVPVGFAYGAPLNLAALSGDLDIVLTADQPALVLLSRSANFAVLGRLMYNRTCVYAPPSGQVAALTDLRGRTVLGPVGASASG